MAIVTNDKTGTLQKVKTAYERAPVFGKQESTEDTYLRAFKVGSFKDLATDKAVMNDLMRIVQTSGNVTDLQFDRKYRAIAGSILREVFHFAASREKLEIITAIHEQISEPDLAFDALRNIDFMCRTYFPADKPESQKLLKIFDKTKIQNIIRGNRHKGVTLTGRALLSYIKELDKVC